MRSCSPLVLVRLDALFWTPQIPHCSETRDVLLIGDAVLADRVTDRDCRFLVDELFGTEDPSRLVTSVLTLARCIIQFMTQ